MVAMAGTLLGSVVPAEIASLAVIQRIAWLDSSDACGCMTATARKRERRRLFKLRKNEEAVAVQETEAIRENIRSWACSDPWQERCFGDADIHGLGGGHSSKHQAMRSGIYPPGGHESLMVICPKCRKYVPPNATNSRGICDDCRYSLMSPAQIAGLPGSIGIISMARMKGVVARGENYEGGL